MATTGLALFDTSIGRCGIAWRDDGVIAALQLPEADDAATLARLARAHPTAALASPPMSVSAVIDAVARLLRGEDADLSGTALAMDGIPVFHRAVYDVARTIPPGTALTYGEVARRLGDPGAARAVGQALGRNPFAILVPCHRVVAARGATGGFSAHGGAETKQRILALEGFGRDAPTLPGIL